MLAKISMKLLLWVVIEVTSFSLLSKMYSNLKDDDQDSIADYYNNNRFFIRNWLYALSTLRNICALIEEYDNVDIAQLGFLETWQHILKKI